MKVRQLEPSPFDEGLWGCPRCGFPLNPADSVDETSVTCACGVTVVLPDRPYPDGRGWEDVDYSKAAGRLFLVRRWKQ